MSLETTMRSLAGRHTYADNKPIYFLLHKDDIAYLLDKHHEDFERYKKLKEKMGWKDAPPTFNGILMLESELAAKGHPLVVCVS